MVDDIKHFNDKIGVFILLVAMMIVFIPSTSSKYVKEYSLNYKLSTKLAQFRIIWTDQTGSNAPSSQLVSKGDIGFTADGYYLIVAKGGNGASVVGPDDVEYNGGYGGIVGGIFRINPANVTLEVALGTSAAGTTAGTNSKGCLLGGNSSSAASVGGSTGGGAGTMLLVKNDSCNGSSEDNQAAVNKLVLLGAGGGGTGALAKIDYSYDTFGFIGGAGGSNFINATTKDNVTLAVSSFDEYYGNDGDGSAYGAAGTYDTALYVANNKLRTGTCLGLGLTMGNGGIDNESPNLGAGGGGGFGAGAAANTFAGGAGGGSSAINTTSSITNIEYQSSYSASRVLELYKEKMAEIMSLDTTVNSSGKKLSDLCVLGNEGYLYRKDDATKYSDISFVAIYYLGSTAP